jgi:hypothetical protein
MGRYRVNRSDTGSKELIAYAKSIGFDYAHLGGEVDGFLWIGSKVAICDWKKAKGGALTPAQAKLVARGAPIHFISTPEQLDQLRAEVSHT